MSTETNHKTLPPSLPASFSDIKQESIVVRQLAGLLELIRLNEETLSTIESNYSAAVQWGGMYENKDLDCLCFDSGLFTASGKRIYIGIRQRDENWHLDCAIRRDKGSLESLGELLRPNNSATPPEEGTQEDSPAASANQEPSPAQNTATSDAAGADTGSAAPEGDASGDEPPANAIPSSLEQHDSSFLQKEDAIVKGIPVDDCASSEDTPVENSASDSDQEEEISPEIVDTPVESEQNPEETPEEPVLKGDYSSEPVDFDIPPVSWNDVVFPRSPTQEYLAQALGYEDKILPPGDFQQIFKDYTKALHDPTDGIRRQIGKPQYSFLLSRTTPQGEPLVLTFVPTKPKDTGKPKEGEKRRRPWFCNRVSKVWPPKHSVPVFSSEEPSAEDETAIPDEPSMEEMAQNDAPVQPIHQLTKDQAQQIYDTLVPPYRPGETVLLSKLGQQLSTHGINCRSFGYNSFLQMLSDLPDLFTITSITPDNGAALIYQAKIQPWPEDETASSSDQDTASEEEASSDISSDGNITDPPFSMTDRQIEFSITQRDMLSRLVNGEGVFDTTAVPLTAEQVTEFRNSYDAAVAEGKLAYDSEYDCYSFPLTLLAQDGSAISANIRRGNNPKKAPWFVCYIRKERAQGVRPKDRLTNFAYLGDFQVFLRSLAEHAEPEQWSFSGEAYDFTILENYIRYTFYRLEFESKIVIDEENGYAAFDTGLLSRRFGDPLFAVFEPNHRENAKQKWKFNCFCSTFQEGTPAERNTAAKLTIKPQMPSYFTNIYDTIFDPDAEMQVNYEHIFRDNLDRFPLRWVHAQCDSWPRTQSIMKQIDALEPKISSEKKLNGKESPLLAKLLLQRKNLFKQLGAAVNDTTDDDMQTLFDNMIYNLRGCIEKTLMRSRRNHQLAEPCFFPTRNVMSMLLPIRLFRSDAPDLALVLERQKSTVYIGRTVITMAMAYKNARLIRRFTSDWLNNYSIQDDDTDED